MSQYKYNEHDENQVHKILKQKKKKKMKKKIKILFGVIFLIAIIGLFMSPVLKVKTIAIKGLQLIEKEDILQHISIKDSYYFLLNKDNLEKQIKELERVKDVQVTSDLLGKINIDITEAQAIAYASINNQIYEINEVGQVIEIKDQERIDTLKSLPMVMNFKDLEMLKKFASEYKDVSSLNRYNMSDISLKPMPADETLLECLLIDDYIIYIRIEDLSSRLGEGGFDFEAQKTKYPDQRILSFEGKNMYVLTKKK